MKYYCIDCEKWYNFDDYEDVECCPKCGGYLDDASVNIEGELRGMYPDGIDDGVSIDCQSWDR